MRASPLALSNARRAWVRRWRRARLTAAFWLPVRAPTFAQPFFLFPCALAASQGFTFRLRAHPGLRKTNDSVPVRNRSFARRRFLFPCALAASQGFTFRLRAQASLRKTNDSVPVRAPTFARPTIPFPCASDPLRWLGAEGPSLSPHARHRSEDICETPRPVRRIRIVKALSGDERGAR